MDGRALRTEPAGSSTALPDSLSFSIMFGSRGIANNLTRCCECILGTCVLVPVCIWLAADIPIR